MGSSPSVEHGASSGGGTGAVHAQEIESPSPSLETDGRNGGTDGLHPINTITRSRSRHALIKKLVKGRVVLLGLDGAGKTTLVKQLQRLAAQDDPLGGWLLDLAASETTHTPLPLTMLQSVASRDDIEAENGTRIPRLFPDPTKATTSSIYRLDGDRYVQLIDVPGRRVYRAAHWRAALQGDPPSPSAPTPQPIVGVVFVVDATDHTRFPLVAQELVAFQKLKDARTATGTFTSLATWLQRAPFLMVLNKVDAAASGSGGENTSTQDTNSVERRRASRLWRQQLKTAFDHQLRMDQKKHPKDYASVVAPASAVADPSMLGGGSGMPPVPTASKKQAALAEANNNRKTLLMASIVECCAFDTDCVRAIHTLLRDDIRRLWSGAP